MKIKVKVKPNSRENSIIEIEKNYYEVRVSVPPEKGKANEKVIELISKHLKIPKSHIDLISGAASKDKVFIIPG
ncbi:MAG: DUF167 domain-containing protein [Ignavibacteria bacterium]|nr:DUF167 domain-containing protein [Ignavibacteria bacterium]